MKVVLIMGAAYKFSKNSWKRFLEMWVTVGEMPNIDRYATLICNDTPNITDWSVDDVKNMLSELVT